MDMTGTYLRLPKTTLRRMKALAAARDKSLAQLVREAIEKTYHIGASLEEPLTSDPFDLLIGAFNSGRSDGAVNHDDIIYGR